MEPKQENILLNTLKPGIILGIVLVIYSITLYILDISTVKVFGYLLYLLIIGGLIFGIKQYRDKELGGYISYPKALGVGVLVLLFASIISSIYTYINLTFIDPTLIDKMLEITEKEMFNKGLSDDQIEMALKMSAKLMKPGIMAIMGFAVSMFFGFILTLIVAAFLKKEQDIFSAQNNL